MLYDLSKEIDKSKFKTRCESALEKGSLVDFTDKKESSNPQKNYLHLILGYFAIETGNTLEYVKDVYFKRECNKDIFIREREDRLTEKKVKYIRGTMDLDSAELSLAIDRFRNWSSTTANIYLPEPNEDRFLNEIRIEIDKNRRYL
jgi:hypothetical protein